MQSQNHFLYVPPSFIYYVAACIIRRRPGDVGPDGQPLRQQRGHHRRHG